MHQTILVLSLTVSHPRMSSLTSGCCGRGSLSSFPGRTTTSAHSRLAGRLAWSSSPAKETAACLQSGRTARRGAKLQKSIDALPALSWSLETRIGLRFSHAVLHTSSRCMADARAVPWRHARLSVVVPARRRPSAAPLLFLISLRPPSAGQTTSCLGACSTSTCWTCWSLGFAPVSCPRDVCLHWAPLDVVPVCACRQVLNLRFLPGRELQGDARVRRRRRFDAARGQAAHGLHRGVVRDERGAQP